VGGIAGTEGQNGKRRIAFDEALAQRNAQPRPPEASGTDQGLLVAGVEHQDVVVAGRSRLGTGLLAYRPDLPHHLTTIWLPSAVPCGLISGARSSVDKSQGDEALIRQAGINAVPGAGLSDPVPVPDTMATCALSPVRRT
jgi:hypothetical protein